MSIKVAVINYLNSRPFTYGLKQSEIIKHIDLIETTPNECAKLLVEKKCDIGLAPVAVIPMLTPYYIISDYCIGSKGTVKSVCIYSDIAIEDVKQIYTDNHSWTSVMLSKILAEHYWKIKPEWIISELNDIKENNKPQTILAIGDKTFNLRKIYKYCYDLGDEWLGLTSMPFVFACWIANRKLANEFNNEFNNAICFGVQQKSISIENTILKKLNISYQEAIDYLTYNIDYQYNETKQKALDLFLNYASKMGLKNQSMSIKN